MTTQVLIIGYVWPEPNSSAAGSRMMQLIKSFQQQNWQVTFASPAADSGPMADLDALGVKKENILLNDASFDYFINELAPDIVLFDRFMMEEQFAWRVEQQVPNALRLLDTEDLHCLREARHQALKSQRDLNIEEDMHSELAIREISAILRCDLSLMISKYEFKLLIQHFKVPEALLLQLPFMLPTADISNVPSFDEREHYLCIGNFRHVPNWDAVLYLKNTIWPLIKQQQPEAQCHIYGAYPPPKATQLNNPKQGFLIKGWAEDAKQVMQTARICLAPLRFGAGLKGKLVEAMQCGTPSVTTTIGAEAMHGDLAWNGTIENDPEAFAKAATNLYKNEQQWHQAQKNGIAIINAGYQESKLAKHFITRINKLITQLPQHRNKNFTGMILRHHSMKSTKYMAQWIEAKNKNAP